MSKAGPSTRDMIGRRIREARKMAGLSQDQLAKFLKLHRPAISEIEAGHRRVSAEELGLLAELLDVNVAWLLGEASDNVVDDDPRIQLAARELRRLKPEDLERILKVLAAIKR
jgi:transcriptional regulator with XRE-family HTH domain